jgi:hypothetical protein
MQRHDLQEWGNTNVAHAPGFGTLDVDAHQELGLESYLTATDGLILCHSWFLIESPARLSLKTFLVFCQKNTNCRYLAAGKGI